MTFTGHTDATRQVLAQKTKDWFAANPGMAEVRGQTMRAGRKTIVRQCKWCWDEFGSYARNHLTCPSCIVIERFDFKLREAYGISFYEYQELFLQQDGKCVICEGHSTNVRFRLSVDHCHKSNEVRGLLCNSCNLVLGNMHDSPKLLRAAADYVERNSNG